MLVDLDVDAHVQGPVVSLAMLVFAGGWVGCARVELALVDGQAGVLVVDRG